MKKDHDLIYRQAALEVLKTSADLIRRALDCMDLVGAERDKFEWGLGLIDPLIYDMESLPSAHPSATDTNVGGNLIEMPQVVRCKECKWWHDWNGECYGNGNMGYGARRKADDFCSWGKRKDAAD